jgi:uracil-DNA glycosylase
MGAKRSFFMHFSSLKVLNEAIAECRRCPRLVDYRENLPPKPIHQEETYWRRPVPGFGDPNASILIFGLAPASHGGNRTGRVLTGDKTADFLFKSLYELGLCNQPTSITKDDGLQLYDLYLTASVKCAPPKDKPTRQESLTCHSFFLNEMLLLKNLKKVIVLGHIAFNAFLFYAKSQGVDTRGLKFGFGNHYIFPGLPTLFACYHPSPRNTQTGRMTQAMLTSFLSDVLTYSSDLLPYPIQN